MNLLKMLFGLLPLKLKRRINKRLVSIGLKTAPKPRAKRAATTTNANPGA